MSKRRQQTTLTDFYESSQKRQKMQLVPASQEQLTIINALDAGHNVVANAVAGSGKTTCNLHIATHFAKKRMLLLTYSKKLQLETEKKMKEFKIRNLTVSTFHGFCSKYYRMAPTDTEFDKVVEQNTFNQLKETFEFDIISVDETQDATLTYFAFVCMIFRDNKVANKNNVQLCIFGDNQQSIFRFKLADSRFITKATTVFCLTPSHNVWAECKLSTSYRLTNEMVDFMNNCVLAKPRMHAVKQGSKPRYLICNVFNDVFDEVKYYLQTYAANDIFILATSITSTTTPAKKLENRIVKELPDVKIFVPGNDDVKITESQMQNKLVISTIHQAKGLERKVVILLGFDAGFYLCSKTESRIVCPDTLYVATTRASEQLTVVHHYENEYLPFLKQHLLDKYCNVLKIRPHRVKQNTKSVKPTCVGVTKLLMHLPSNVISTCLSYLTITVSNPAEERISIPTQVKYMDGTAEDVSDITGVAIPSLFELELKNKMSIIHLLQQEDSENVIIPIDFDKLTKITTGDQLSTSSLLQVANVWCSATSGYHCKQNQVLSYDWLTDDARNMCIARMQSLGISKKAMFEHQMDHCVSLSQKLCGHADCVDVENYVVYEFKCTQSLESKHILQLAIYMFLYETHRRKTLLPFDDSDFRVVKHDLLRNIAMFKHQIHMRQTANIICDCNVPHKIEKNTIIGYYDESTNDTTIYRAKVHKTATKRSQQVEITLLLSTKPMKIPKRNVCCIEQRVLSEDEDKEEDKEEDEEKDEDSAAYIQNLQQKKALLETQLEELQDSRLPSITYKLINILTNECISLCCKYTHLCEMVEYLLHEKYKQNKAWGDDAFLRATDAIKHKHLGNLYTQGDEEEEKEEEEEEEEKEKEEKENDDDDEEEEEEENDYEEEQHQSSRLSLQLP